jgi:hypothetical protein
MEFENSEVTEDIANSQDYYLNPFDVTKYGLMRIIRWCEF